MREATTNERLIAEWAEQDAPPEACFKDGMSPTARCVKRFLDIIGSAVGMVLATPLFLTIYFAIRHEDRGKAIFRQERIGYRGQAFTLYKFRSMSENGVENESNCLCQKEDARLTRTGRFIRDHHLDELPQLWNVLKGDMSFVGPRPERRIFVNRTSSINPNYTQLYRLRPGLFSMATLYNGYTDTMEKMLKRLDMDLDYLATRSLWTDMRIILLTVSALVIGKKI